MMRNKSLGLIHLMIAVGTIFFCTLRGQVLYEQPEIIPYRFVPAYDNYCWVDVEIVEPISIQNLVGIHKYEITEIIKERIGFELVNPMEQSQIFSIDDKLYYLVKLPYDVTSPDWYDKATKYGER
jgi:hypothetical protein